MEICIGADSEQARSRPTGVSHQRPALWIPEFEECRHEQLRTNQPPGDRAPRSRTEQDVRVSRYRRFARCNLCIASSISVFIQLANLCDHGRASVPAEGPTIAVKREAGTHRGGCADWIGDGIVRRPRHVVLSRGRATHGRQQLPWTSWIRRTGFQCTIWTGRRRIVRHGRECGQIELHPDIGNGSAGDG